MDVYNAKTAHAIADAWQDHGTRGVKMLRSFADDQRVCAQLAHDLGRSVEQRNHLAAERVLRQRADQIVTPQEVSH